MTTTSSSSPLDGSRGCLIVSGVPGAGKSTVAGLVAAALPRCAVTDADAVAMMVRSGWVGPVDEPADEARSQLMLRARNACLLAGSFSEAGFFPVIDHVVADAEMLEAMLGWLAPSPVWFVTLGPDLATARHRNALRPEREQIDYDISGLHAAVRAELGDRGWWFDTTDLDAETTARRVLDEAPARAEVTAGERRVRTPDGAVLWARESGDPAGTPVLLVMGAASSSAVWPPALLERLGRHHRVLVWDHRDTGRSSRSGDDVTYALTDLAEDAVAVLDAFGVDAAHVVGMSMGGLLVQLLLLDHPDRLRSATLFCTGPLAGADVGGDSAPGPSEELLALWARLGEPRDEAAEMAFRLEHWRLLNGTATPFDEREFRALEERSAAHGGPLDASSATAHARAGTGGLDRGAELRGVRVPVLVVEAPADPAYPPPSAELLQRAIGTAASTHRVAVPGMGHALPSAVLGPFGDAVEAHLDDVDACR